MASIRCRAGETGSSFHMHDSAAQTKRCWLPGTDRHPARHLDEGSKNPWTEIRQAGQRVPAGRYAVKGHREGEIKFFKITRPEEGRFQGYTFMEVQAGSDFHRIKNPNMMLTWLSRIAEDPRAASAAYGRELGRCGVCGRTLTHQVSREIGIGPDCRERLGW